MFRLWNGIFRVDGPIIGKHLLKFYQSLLHRSSHSKPQSFIKPWQEVACFLIYFCERVFNNCFLGLKWVPNIMDDLVDKYVFLALFFILSCPFCCSCPWCCSCLGLFLGLWLCSCWPFSSSSFLFLLNQVDFSVSFFLHLPARVDLAVL